MEPLVRDQALQVPDMEDRSYRPYFSVLHEHGFKHEVKKSRGFPKEQPQQSLPAFCHKSKSWSSEIKIEWKWKNKEKCIQKQVKLLPETDHVSLVASNAVHFPPWAVAGQKPLNLETKKEHFD